MKLTDREIRGMKPGAKAKKAFDGGGLYLEVSKAGAKTFRMKCRFDGREKAVKIGVYPGVGLGEARRRRDMVRAAIHTGTDPAGLDFLPPRARDDAVPSSATMAKPSHPVEIQPEPQPRPDRPGPEADAALGADSWREVAREYLQFRKRQKISPKTLKKLEYHVVVMERHLGHLQIGDVTGNDILEMVRVFEAEGKFETAHALRSRCSQVLKFAHSTGRENTNPAESISYAMAKKVVLGRPALTDPWHVGRLMRDIRGYVEGEATTRVGLLLSAYLFPRNETLRGMRWDEIDWKRRLWEIPGHRMKGEGGGLDHVVPLPQQALAILKEIHALTGDCELVLPAPRNRANVLSDATFNKALRRLGYDTKADHCHHGFRSTASTNLNEMGFNRDWIERQLAHVERNKVRGAYNKAQYLEGRTAMMQAYADWLDKVEVER